MRALSHLPVLLALLTSVDIAAQTGPPDQQVALDSLYAIWQEESQPDSIRADAYVNYITRGFLSNDPDSAFSLAEQLIAFVQEKKYIKGKAQAYSIQGTSSYLRGDYSQALEYGERCLQLSKKIGYKEGISNSLNNIGATYRSQSNYSQALDYYQQSLMIAKGVGDNGRMSAALNNIGDIYFFQGSNSEALDYYRHSLALLEGTEAKNEIARTLLCIGDIGVFQGSYPEALNSYERSLKIYEEIKNEAGIASILNGIGNLYKAQGNYAQALDYCLRSVKRYEGITDKAEIVYPLFTVGDIYNIQGMPKRAVIQCKRVFDLSNETGDIFIQKAACFCLYEAHKAMGNSNKALSYHEQMLVLQDSMNAGETAKKLQQMEFQKVMLADSLHQQKERMNVELVHQREVSKKNKVRNFLVGSGLVFVALAIGFFNRWRYVKKSRDIISKEKDRSENLLLNILPAEIAEELKEKGEAAARDFERASILFTDFKGFTQASEKLSATDLVAEINTCFKAFDAIVGKHNIEKIKTIGDAYMCAGGLPVPNVDSVKNTVYAGLEMQAFMIARKKERDAQGLPAFEMRVGIHTGPVVAGIVGVKKFQYDIWGDTVNTASRMESSGEVGQVNISEATYALVKDEPDLSFTPRGKVQAKGKGELEMYFVQRG